MIKDLVLKSFFTRFTESWNIAYNDTISEAKAFEKFVNHTILSLDDVSAFVGKSDLLDFCSPGGGNDAKLDGVGIKINGRLVGNKEDIEQIVEASKKIEVEFVLIQSKEKTDFDSAEFNTFGIGAQNFFSKPRLPESEALTQIRDLKDYIYNDMSVIRKLEDNPSVSIYYVFCGNAPQDDHTESLKDIIKENLSKCSDSLSNINVSIIDGSELKKICKDLENDYSVELNIRDIIPLTVNDNNLIKKAYTFTCDAKEFLKLLRKDDDTIRRSLFNDNVRDYLGNKGVVNSEIEKTIINEPEMFLMCNNGITIVCSDFLQIRDKLVSIDNPQIVNGCQTCNSIFAQKENTSLEKVQLLIKLICTEDISITNKVVRGTNKQNQVLEESFESTKLFHQNLEDYFCAKIGEPRLYYERRNKQYSSIPTINKFQIVNLRVLTQTFVSMFLHLPYMAHRHEAKLLSEFACEDNRKIYVDNHSCTPYYICALTWYMFENAFRKNILPKKAKTYKAHLYYIFTFITGQYPLTCEMKKKSIDNFCDKLERVLLSNNFNNIAHEVCQVFYYCKNEWEKMGKNRYAIKDTKDFTEFLCCKSREKFVNKTLSIDNNEEFIAPNTEWKEGKILTVKIKEGKWFAFISVDNNSSNVYFDDRAYKGDFNKLLPKVKVRFIQGKNRSNEYFAKQVQILKS
ncbi:AIPR family protein [Bacteroides thetaiotaomicron]|jgi:hypothetical protein|uniref:AIPR family protein n=1 Tax=Bacteroides thetaiotaomicron TaxID=818 RepID=UPI00221ED454|nr:AIPR family protein [Bacteroides thetaiotaomicron]UYU78710.1 AIPR family protein [Bacteroides thetaiotaomicron]